MERNLHDAVREQGNALFFTLMLLMLLLGLAAAQAAVQQKNVQQSRFFVARKSLHKYAETGIAMGIHDVRHTVTASPGNIGTENWTDVYDYGRDGVAATGDEGEGDGIPTAGEPEVFPVSIGPSADGIRFFVHVLDAGIPNVQRVISTAFNDEASVTLEKQVQSHTATVPTTGAVFLAPEMVLDLNGNSFIIDGNDHDMSGNPSGGATFGLSTAAGTPAGDNAAGLVAQISSEYHDQVLGDGGTPSVGEVEELEVNALVSEFEAVKTHDIAPGTYSSLDLGTGSMPVAFVAGDLQLTGNGEAEGALIVDGNLTMSGQFSWRGLIIVRGDIILTGGGAEIHVIGALIVGQSLTALDESDVSLTGSADIYYSQEALDAVQSVLSQHVTYTGVYYKEY